MADWAVPAASKIKYSQIFNSNDNQRTGLLTGVQARNILIQSGLSQQILAQIWFLSDCDKDGMLTCEEFILAMHLIDRVKLEGVKLPTTLPPELIPPAIRRKLSIQSPTLSVDKTKEPIQIKPPEIPSPALVEWNIPQASKLKYTQLFNQVDANRTGFLTGIQARNILLKSGLSNQHLANIWNLSDIDKDGNLTCEEFILSMHLIDMIKAGDTLPIQLPLELIPLNYRKKPSINGPVQATSAPTLVNQSSIESIGNRNTFEDKRKENFEKGQAELEKRRQLLLDQQRREQEERERKEKEEFEKRERIRLEQERKKKEEMERQLQKQREIEMQKEEERKKQQELKEAARRKMERQRMIEWENQKKSEMEATKQRVQEALINLKAKKQRMIVDVEQVSSQLNGLKERAEETRAKVSEAKQEIDKMRVTRDAKLKEMNAFKLQIKTLHERHLIIEQEKLSLATQLKNLNVIENHHNITDSADFALKSKQIRIEQLKQQLVENEKEKEVKEKDIEEHRAELENYKKAYEEIEERTKDLQRIYDDKRKEALEVIERSIKQAEEASKYALDLNAGWGAETTQPQEQVTANENYSAPAGVVRYKALYQFDGTNPDDLSFNAGDIINAVSNSQPDAGWLQGELNGKEGWFPVNFVEVSQADGSVSVNAAQLTESPANVNSSLNETYANVLYDWNGTDPENHLAIKKDDKIKILDSNQDWLFGEIDGKTGWLPKSYVNYDSPTEWFISTFAFESAEQGDLTFDANELIHVTKKEGEWWTGEISKSRKGIFPNTFVREATEEEISASKGASKSNEKETIPAQTASATTGNWPESVEHTPSRSSETAKSKKSKAAKKPEIVCAVANYKPTSKEQLELKKGQMIQVRKKLDSGWLMGEIQVKGQKKQIGYFPASYVKSIGKTGGDDVSSQQAPKSPQVVKEEKIERVVTLYPYAASQDDELSFQGNEIIKVLSKDEWWKGESETTGKVGLFPSNYTQPYRGYGQHQLPYRIYDQTDELSSSNFDESLLDYQTSSNLDFESSSFCTDEEEDFDSYLTNQSDQQVIYSKNHLFHHSANHIITSKDYAFIESTSATAPNGHLIKKELTRDEILFKREQNIVELIKTEEDYVNDLRIVIEVYQHQILRSPYLSIQLAGIIFLNWRSLFDCNQQFLNDLKARQIEGGPVERIGDILKFHLKDQMCDKYTNFCSNQMKSIKVFEEQMQVNYNFKNQISLCNELNKAKLKLQDFTSYILKPMQRITRYVLLVKSILKHTPFDHSDYQECTEAFRDAENLCESVNRSCQLAENEERLEWVQRGVKCTGIDQRIKYNSSTKFCGMRTLVFYGRVINDSKNKTLLGLLFNDFFILVKNVDKHKRIQKYANLFICKEALESKYRVYKRPFMLDDVEVILSAKQLTDDSAPNLICMLNSKGEFRPNLKFFCLKIHSLKKYLFLRAFNGHDRKQWIHHFSESIENYVIKKSIFLEKYLNNLMQNFDCNEKVGTLSLTVIRLNNFKTRNYVLNAYCSLSIGKSHIAQEKHDIFFKSKVAKFKSNENHLFDAVFNFAAKFFLSNQMINCDQLAITCIEESPFSPDQLIGKAEINLKNLINDELTPGQTVLKSVEFKTNSHSSRSDCVLQIKYRPTN